MWDGRYIEVKAIILFLALLANTVNIWGFLLQYSKVHSVALCMLSGSYGVSAAYLPALQIPVTSFMYVERNAWQQSQHLWRTVPWCSAIISGNPDWSSLCWLFQQHCKHLIFWFKLFFAKTNLFPFLHLNLVWYTNILMLILIKYRK